MKKYATVLMSIMLLTFGFSINSQQVFASTLMEEKENIIQDLEIIKNSDISKKTKKNIESAIKQIEKTLNAKFWKDGSTLNFKHGKKVLNADQNAINKLDKILKNKKELDSVKEDILQINFRIAEVDKTLVGNTIDRFEDIMMGKKGLKKIDKAINNFEKGNDFLEDEKYSKSIKKYAKAWDYIKKALKDPHFKKMKMIELEGTDDYDEDGLKDVYLKIINPKKSKNPKQVEIKISSQCVKGISHEDAGMKVGFSTQVRLSTEFFDEEFNITNEWFKKYDLDKKIDPVVIDSVSEYFSFPESGDDLIQINTEDMEDSFDFVSEIPELDGQSGWKGKFEFKGEPGDYNMNFWFPPTEPATGFICNFLSVDSIPTTIDP